jgi:peroxiredoxin
MRVLFFFLACFFGLQLSAQNTFRLTERSVVKDSSGTVYPYAIWQSLMRTGEYTVKAENSKDSSTAFVLIRLSADAKEARFQKMPKPKESNFFTTGDKISLFNVRDIDNNPLDLKDAKGKIIVLNFWFINCGPCRREIPELNALVDSFKTNDKVLFVGIALDNKDDLKNFLEKLPFKYAIVDNGRFIADKYGVRLYPTHVIVDAEGKVYFHTSGLAVNTVYWINKSIKELLAKSGKDVAAQ